MLKVSNKKLIDIHDWNDLVRKTYGKIYNFQQQRGCQPRGLFHIPIPSDYTEDEEMNDDVTIVVNGGKKGIKFEKWLEKDSKIHNFKNEWENELFWERNFYPDIYTVANDLHKKGLIEPGDYIIEIDW
jgi:hypothetical protein